MNIGKPSTIPGSPLGHNPLTPPGVYAADPEAHVWDDGKMYLYVSRDESTREYCSQYYHVLSSADLIRWDIHTYTFATTGEFDQVSYSNDRLAAPDCLYRDGMYYLYYCIWDGGVATSPSPIGPF